MTISKVDFLRAIDFGISLEDEYLNLIKRHKKAGEVAYFKDLKSAFELLSKSFVVDVVHGASHLVEFNCCKMAWTRAQPRCEIADLRLVVYRTKPVPSIRMSYIQVKLEKGNGQLKLNTEPKIFKANLEQWELLSHRPSIRRARRTFSPQQDLLSGALMPSVGSFLFLAPFGSNFMPNSVYAPANKISLYGKSNSTSGRVKVGRSGFSKKGHYCEAGRLDGCWQFGAAAHMHLIGTPLEIDKNAKDNSYRSRMRLDLLHNLRSASNESRATSGLIKMLSSDNDRIDQTPSRNSCPTVIVVNTDRE